MGESTQESPLPPVTRAEVTTGPNPPDRTLVGCRLEGFTRAWEEEIGDQASSRTVREGVLIQFGPTKPTLSKSPVQFPARTHKSAEILEATHQLLLKGAIETVKDTSTPGFYSRLFTVPKASGGVRPVIDLSTLNTYLVCPKFKMETSQSIRQAVLPGEWVTSIDIQDAYLHIPLAQSVRRYFRFVVDGVAYQFRSLPFGLNSAPREFTRLLHPLLKKLRKQGIKVHAYLDDWIIRAKSREECLRHTQEVLRLLERLGWLVNHKKSSLTPSQSFDFLSMSFDTVRATVAPAAKFHAATTAILVRAKHLPRWSARRLHQIVGLLQFLATLVHRGRLNLRPIQSWIRERWVQRSGRWSDILKVDSKLVSFLGWWARREILAGVPLVSPEPSISMCTDASKTGWGAHLEVETASGVWPPELREAHINELELRAVLLALQQF